MLSFDQYVTCDHKENQRESRQRTHANYLIYFNTYTNIIQWQCNMEVSFLQIQKLTDTQINQKVANIKKFSRYWHCMHYFIAGLRCSMLSKLPRWSIWVNQGLEQTSFLFYYVTINTMSALRAKQVLQSIPTHRNIFKSSCRRYDSAWRKILATP